MQNLEAEVGLRTVWSNSWSFSQNRLVLDAETRHGILSLRLGILDAGDIGLQIPYQWRGGGMLDPFIEDFHEAFGLSRAERNRRPQNRYLVQGTQSDLTPYELEHKGYGFSDMVLELRGKTYPGGPILPAAAATLRLRLPTGRSKFELSDGVDVTISLDLSKRIGHTPFLIYAGLAYTYYAHAHVDGLDLLRHRGFVYVGGEWELTPWLSLVVHGWWESKRERKLFRNPSSVDRNPFSGPLQEAETKLGNYISYVAFGLKARWEPVVVELGVVENIIDPDTTADFAILGNLTVQF